MELAAGPVVVPAGFVYNLTVFFVLSVCKLGATCCIAATLGNYLVHIKSLVYLCEDGLSKVYILGVFP